MTRIRVTCPTCGEMELTPDDIELNIVGNEHNVCDGSAYCFTCPGCTNKVTKPADTRIVSLLIHGDVHITYVDSAEIEAEVAKARSELNHPEFIALKPFTMDDLIDFHQLLQEDDWFDRLKALTDA